MVAPNLTGISIVKNKKPFMSKKVSFFIPGFYGGGGERAMIRIAKGFLDKGAEVDFVVVKNEGELKNEVSDEINIVSLDSSRIFLSIIPLAIYLYVEKPSSVISAMTISNIAIVLASKLSLFRGNIVTCEQNNLSGNLRNFGFLKQYVIRILSNVCYNLSDDIVVVSNGVKKDMIENNKLDESKIKVIYNPVVDKSVFTKKSEKLDLSIFSSDKKVIIGVGSLTEQKDFGNLIKSFCIVKKSIDSKLVILGDGKKRGDLCRLVRELGLDGEVKMPGFVKNPIKYMANSDVFVLSSKWEGLPFVLVEALASGCPVVSTDCPSGPREILRGGKFGRLVPVSDERSLARAICDTLENPDYPATEEERIHRAKDFSAEAAIDQYWSIIEQYV